MNYSIKKRCARKINSFYGNVSRKYRHTYSQELMEKNVHDAFNSIYQIERTLLRRENRPFRDDGRATTWPTPTNGILHTPSMERR